MANLAAAQSGDRRRALEELRDTLARALDECDPNMHAQIAGQYRATLADLAALDGEKPKVSSLDELSAARKARQETSKTPVRRRQTKAQ